MHQIIERLERLLTLVVLLLLGVAMTNGVLSHLRWEGVLVGLLLVFVVRPATAFLALSLSRSSSRVGRHVLDRSERAATAFFGVRGVGSLFNLAKATGEARFTPVQQLWSTVAFTVALSVLVHGVTATPVMRMLDRARHG
jgi:NhaP-type Na+/H+ or K+/H+ antiporter